METVHAALVVEDQPLIAVELEQLLRDAGLDDIRTFTSCADAEEWLDHHTPRIAVIETRLHDGGCEAIAKALLDRNVPFIVHTVESSPARHVSALRDCTKWIEKPCKPELFLATLEDCLSEPMVAR